MGSPNNCLKPKKPILIGIISVLMLLVLSSSFSTQAFATSETMNFQGKIVRNDAGNEGLNITAGTPACVIAGVNNDTCDFKVTYYNTATLGVAYGNETFTDLEIGEYNGLFNLNLGTGTFTSGSETSFRNIFLKNSTVYYEVQFAPAGAGSYTETFTDANGDRMAARAAAYALSASGATDQFQFDVQNSEAGYSNIAEGQVFYDGDDDVLRVYNGSAWLEIQASSGGALWQLNTATTPDTIYSNSMYDVAMGGTDSTSPFFLDVSGEVLTLTNTTVGNSFVVNDVASDTTPFVIDASGQVGIGTATPATKFHLAGTSSSDFGQIDTGLNFDQVDTDGYISVALLTTSGNVDEGVHYYGYTYTTAIGETSLRRTNTPTTFDATHKQATVTVPISSDYRVTGRKLYRSKADQAYGIFYLLDTISDNTTTEYVDNIADSGLGTINNYRLMNSTNSIIQINGQSALFADEFGTALGVNALQNMGANGGYNNTAIGYSAGQSITTGYVNTLIGSWAGKDLTTQSYNVIIGEAAGYKTTSSSNVIIGGYAAFGNPTALTGPSNVVIGSQAGYKISGASLGNVMMGFQSGHELLVGSKNVLLGYQSGYNETGSNKLYIENSNSASPLIYGEFDNDLITINGKLGVGMSPASGLLSVKANTASEAQIHLATGVNPTTPVDGDLWYNGSNLYFYDGASSVDILVGSGGGGDSLFTDGGAVTYLTALADDLALGGTDSTAPFFFDEGAEILSLTNTTAGNSFRVNDEASDTSPFVIDANGNVGIGTATPGAKLDIGGASSTISNSSGDITINSASNNISLSGDNITNAGGAAFAGDVTISGSQFQLGNLTSNPTAVGEGAMYYNTTDDLIYYNTGAGWQEVGAKIPGTTSQTARYDGADWVGSSVLTNDGTNLATTGQFQFGNFGSKPAGMGQGAVVWDTALGSLFVYDGTDWNALSTSQLQTATGIVQNGSYLQLTHGENTFDLISTAWVKVGSTWELVDDVSNSLTHTFGTDFDAQFSEKKKVESVALEYVENNLGDGSDGVAAVTAATDINVSPINSSCVGAGDAANYNVSSFTTNTATLSSTPGSNCIEAGDEVLVINLQGTSSAYGNVGNWETLRVQSVSTNVVTFQSNKLNYYGDNPADDTNLGTIEGTQRVMLQRVPNYTDVSVTGGNLTPTAYNGSKGGVMFFRATGTVTVASTYYIHANETGYRGGLEGAGNLQGGAGGESFCGASGTAGGDGSDYNGATSTIGYCGGGGGAGQDEGITHAASAGSATLGGAGGGGGGAEDGSTSMHGAGGGGAGGGYGTFATAGSAYGTPIDGGTNTSGDGATGYNSGTSYAGAGGGGGTYGDTELTDLMLGSGGGAGGDGEINQITYFQGTNGENGGGIVYIAADTISVSGFITSDGGNAAVVTYAGGGGGGAGGSIKLVGNTLNIGTALVNANGGLGGDGNWADGGTGGEGRISISHSSLPSGTTSPDYDSQTLEYNPYAVYVSEEIETPGATAFNTISWTETLTSYGEVQFQTRSGATDNSADGSWEGWKPVVANVNEKDLENANTHTAFAGTNATISEGDVARNVNYFEDEDESISSNITKITATAADGYGESTIAVADLTDYDYVAFWVRSSNSGQVAKIGVGEIAGNEQEENIYIDKADVWQKVYWDISDVVVATPTAVDAVTKIRLTVLNSGVEVRIDNIEAARYLTTPGGSIIASAANEYIQYRAILTSTDVSYTPTFSDVKVNLTNTDGTFDLDADSVITSGEIAPINSGFTVSPETLDYEKYTLGNGADGAATISTATDINVDSINSSCVGAGDAANYNISSMTSTAATLSSTPGAGCLAVGDEILLINLQGTSTAYQNVGNWETLRIGGISGTVITFDQAKKSYYGDNLTDDSNLGTGAGTQRVMLQRVPNYTSVSVTGGNLTPTAYNGSKGGVMFFRATGTVSVSPTYYIHANETGYRGGLEGAGNLQGGGGGESFCGETGTAGGDGSDYNGVTSTIGYCGGGGGSGQDEGTTHAASAGSASLGGAGGGGGGAEDGSTGFHGAGGGGAGGGYGTFATAGSAAGTPIDGGTNTSGDGATGYNSGTSYGGAGGGGGTYGDAELADLMFGSGGGAGGDGEINQITYFQGTNGGDGGGIVYIAADTISVSGFITSDGGSSSAVTYAGGGGGGAGGSIKLVGNTLNIGTDLVNANGGAGGDSNWSDGGVGGEGIIAVYYEDSIGVSTLPPYTIDSNVEQYNMYKVFTSNEIATPGATAFNTVGWTEDLATYGEIMFQTRSGATVDSTDGTWEDWKPAVATTNVLSLENANTEGNWTGTNLTVAEGDVTRDINYFEDEDEATVINLVKGTSSTAGGYAEASFGAVSVADYQYIAFWVRSAIEGTSVTFGMGETVATEFEYDVSIEEADVWQKVYWDISAITETSIDGITKLRITNNPGVSNTIYFDNITADKYLTDETGSTITSTANEYIQYRAILTTSNTLYTPTLSEVRINITDGSGTHDIDDRLANQNFVDRFDGTDRLSIGYVDLDEERKDRIIVEENSVTLNSDFNPGTGADGSIAVSSDGSINQQTYSAGRSCSDGGDAANYNITNLTSLTATLSTTPSTGCINIGDEVLIISLQGTTTGSQNVGNWETLRVQSMSSNTITFETPKQKYYGDNLTDDSNLGVIQGTQRVMLQRVPNYNDAVIDAGVNWYPDAFDGVKGGVMFFRANGAVSVNGAIYADGLGYRGGLEGSGNLQGGGGGEAFCGESGAAGGDGSDYSVATSTIGYCGGGGGSGHNDGVTQAATAGSATVGGAGGGGGAAEDGSATAYHGYGGGGAGGGYGTFGYGGINYGTQDNGGTNSSGDGGTGYNSTHSYAGQGGGGGSYGDADLTKLMFGSGGGAGGDGEIHLTTYYNGTDGGDGGGIIYIAAETVVVSGAVTSNGVSAQVLTTYGGGGGGGAGGSIKLQGRVINIGTNKVYASAGAGHYSDGGDGGDGGVGRVATLYIEESGGASSPTAYVDNANNYSYGVFISDEVQVSGNTRFNDLAWLADLADHGMLQAQTRSGSTSNSTDGSWEEWRPVTATTNVLSLANANTHTDWIGTNATVSEGDVTRGIDFYEDEDEATAGNLLKIDTTQTGGYAEVTIGQSDLSGYDLLTVWVRAVEDDATVKISMGETTGNEHEEIIDIDYGSDWQKVYWDITDIPTHERDAIKNVRITNIGSAANNIYVDNVTADTYMTNSAGSKIRSTANEYMQYRVIFTTTNLGFRPTMHNMRISYESGYKVEMYDANTVRLHNNSGEEQELKISVTTSGGANGGDSDWVETGGNIYRATGKVGIGDTTPDVELKVVGALCVKSDAADCAGSAAGTIYANTTSVQSADLAEEYEVSDLSINEGDLVALTSVDGEIERATRDNDDRLIGAISTQPGLLMNDSMSDTAKPVGLVGRVPVKVMRGKDDILRGTGLSVSQIDGIASIAKDPGYIVGRAIQDTLNWSTESCTLVERVEDIKWNTPQASNEDKECYRVPVESFPQEQRESIIEEQSLSETGEVYIGKLMVYVNVTWAQPSWFTADLTQLVADYEAGIIGGGATFWEQSGSNIITTHDVFGNSFSGNFGMFNILSGGLLSIAEDKFIVDSGGNLNTAGDITLAGRLKGANGDLIIELGDSSGANIFAIENSNGETVFSVDSYGEVGGKGMYKSGWIKVAKGNSITVEHKFGKTPSMVDLRMSKSSSGANFTTKGLGSDYYYESIDDDNLKIVNTLSEDIFVKLTIQR